MTTADPAADPTLVALAKNIADLDDLVRMLAKAVPRAKSWQRRLSSQLMELDRLLQILRMTIAMERTDPEILEAAKALCIHSRQTSTAAAGTQVDGVTKASLCLVSSLAASILQRMEERLT